MDAKGGSETAPGGDAAAQRDLQVLRETDARRRKVLADISHELKTPLGISLALLDRMLGGDTLAPEHRGDAETVRRHQQTLLAQVNELLLAARLEADQVVLRLQACDLAALVQRVVDDFVPVAQARDILLFCDAPTHLVVRVDPERMAGVVANLVSNSLRFTPRGGRVRTTVRAAADAVHLAVADSGPGIPEELRSAVFERFRQNDALFSARGLGGSGLGLTLVREIVQLHGGHVSASRASEGGALISLVLPSSADSIPSGLTGLGEDVEELLALSAVRLGTELTHSTAAQGLPTIEMVGGDALSATPAPAWELASAFEQSPIGMALLDLSGRWLRVNAALCALLGVSESELRGRDLDGISHPDDVGAEHEHLVQARAGDIRGFQLEKRMRVASGGWDWALMSLAVARSPDGQPSHLILHVDDISARRRTDRRRQLRAARDELTGLARPRRLEQELARCLNSDRTPLGLVLLDIDGMTALNRRHGRRSGDQLLRSCARALKPHLRRGDLLARMHADCFAALLPRAELADVRDMASRLQEAVGGLRVRAATDRGPITAAVGVAIASGPTHADDVLEVAESALRDARRAGPGRDVIRSVGPGSSASR